MTTLASLGGHASYVASGRPVAAVMAHAALTRAALPYLDDVAADVAHVVAYDLATVVGDPAGTVHACLAPRGIRWPALERALVAAWVSR